MFIYSPAIKHDYSQKHFQLDFIFRGFLPDYAIIITKSFEENCYMNRLILLGLLTFLTLLEARIVNAVALTVNGEAITTSEIKKVQRKAHVSKQQAINLLIQDRLQKVAMKNIKISEETIDAKIAQIANLNNISIPQMQKILKQQGTSWSKYRESIRQSMKKERFFKEKVSKTILPPSEDQLKLYYENHKEAFAMPTSLNLTEYSSTSEKKIQNFLRTGSRKGIKSISKTKKTEGMNPAMLSMLLSTPDGRFTKPINAGDKWVVFKVNSKNGKKQMSFENARNAVAGRWRQEQQAQALKDYFSKMKTEANIHIIRK
jgi:parvulin-like peptidyl-prolyl isomerase